MRNWLHHGGRLEQARAHFGGEAADWLDLSTGINPHSWPGADDISPDWSRLPEDEALTALEAHAARFFGTCPEYVCAVPGSEIGLRLLPLTGLPAKALIASPGYRTHGEAFSDSESVSRDALAARLSSNPGGVTALLANPNNPDGLTTPPETIARWADAMAAEKSWLIVDEAFADTHPALSAARLIAPERPLILSRSFGKFFGLAGVRLGFVVAPPPIVERLRRLIGSWPLSSAAIAIGSAAYSDENWTNAMRQQLRAEADALDAVLIRHSLRVRGDCPLFRLAECADAHATFEKLARRMILTRPFDYDRSWLRIGLPGSAQALERLDRALADG